MSDLIREILDRGLVEQEETSIEKAYQALQNVRGIGKTEDPTVSSTIDQTLYGEQGAWKGERAE